MMSASPTTKFSQGSVPSIMPTLPKSVCTKLIIEDAVPVFSLASFSRMSMLNGRITDSMTVKGKKLYRKQKAPSGPANITSSPLASATARLQKRILLLLIVCFILR